MRSVRPTRALAALFLCMPALAGAAIADGGPAGSAGNDPPPLPETARAMLSEALAGGDKQELATIVKYVLRLYPRSETEVTAIVTRFGKPAEAQAAAPAQGQAGKAQVAEVREAEWKGRAELGGFRSTGSVSEFGVSASLTAARKGPRWQHALRGSVDYRRADGTTSRERIEANYGPRFNFNPVGFAYGLVQYEHDPSLGYEGRLTGSAGVGYKLVDTDRLDMSVDVGPSLRHVSYVDDGRETKIGARSSMDINWKINPALTLRQTAQGYAERDVASASSLTALDAKLIDVLTARLSYNVNYEHGRPLPSDRLDTLSKVTLIYDF